MKSVVLLLCCLCAPALSAAAELVKTCDIDGKVGNRVDVMRNSKIAGTYIYYLRRHGSMQPFFENKDKSRGSSVHIVCAGSRIHALVVTGEFTANFLQGFVLRLNSINGLVERLDFAEKNRPVWLYLSPSTTTIVIPATGYGETNKKFVVYRQRLGSAAEPQVIPMDELPLQPDADIIKLGGKPSR
jgi:hypothetical protein